MRVDFYQLSRDPVEKVVPLLARNTLQAGARLLVVSQDAAQMERIDKALWEPREAFLAHGMADAPHAERQPVLLSDRTEPANGARYIALADGQWRDALDHFERVFLLFDDSTIQQARETWRSLDGSGEGERNYWRQDGGKWIKAA